MVTAWTVEPPDGSAEIPTGLRVLVVEDYADCAASMALLLRLSGHDVRVAGDGASALDEAQQFQPDVVLLDIGLPGGMDGYEVAKRLQEHTAEKKPLLVAFTGFGSDADRRHSSEVGIDLHLVKPTDPDNLLRLLRRFQRIIDR
jgi:DNA-binding response OmpR family regulator